MLNTYLGGHNYRKISTFPFLTRTYKGNNSTSRNTKIDIVVEDDVWIGYDSIILAGARIGNGSVVGARSVVTGNVPPYSVYVGNKVIKKRFSDEVIAQVESIDFSSVNHRLGDSYEAYCDTEVSMENITDILESFIKKD